MSIGTVSATVTVHKESGIVSVPITIGNGTAFSGFTSGMSIGTLPSGFRPAATRTADVDCRDNGVWASANYATAIVQVDSSGDVKLFGNQTAIQTMKYISGSIMFVI